MQRIRGVKAGLAALLVGGSLAAVSFAGPASAVVPDPTGTYFPITPSRILDTRTGVGQGGAGSAHKLGAGQILTLGVAGAASGLPPASAISAVVLNVTAVLPSAASFLTVYPDNVSQPTASNLNFPAGWIGANSVTVAIGTGGGVKIYNQAGSLDVIVDAVGYYATSAATGGPGSIYEPVIPIRALDTRDLGAGGPFAPSEHEVVAVDFLADNPDVTAVAVNITAVSPTAGGWLSTWNGQGSPPGPTAPSTLNFTAGAVVPNFAIIPTAPCTVDVSCQGQPAFGIANESPGYTHVVVDIFGYYNSDTTGRGLVFHPISPTRIVDSRPENSVGLAGPIADGATALVSVPTGLLNDNTQALALNLTAILPSQQTWLTVWPAGFSDVTSPPPVSNVNAVPGQVVPNAGIAQVGPTGAFNVTNAHGATNIVADVSGTFDLVSNLVPQH